VADGPPRQIQAANRLSNAARLLCPNRPRLPLKTLEPRSISSGLSFWSRQPQALDFRARIDYLVKNQR